VSESLCRRWQLWGFLTRSPVGCADVATATLCSGFTASDVLCASNSHQLYRQKPNHQEKWEFDQGNDENEGRNITGRNCLITRESVRHAWVRGVLGANKATVKGKCWQGLRIFCWWLIGWKHGANKRAVALNAMQRNKKNKKITLKVIQIRGWQKMLVVPVQEHFTKRLVKNMNYIQ